MREAPGGWLSIGGWIAVGLLLGALPGESAAQGLAPCEGCELRLGVGNTFHFWSRTGGTVIPVTLSWDAERYEVGVFRLAKRQTLSEWQGRWSELLAEPYWAFSASRRWQLAGTPRWRVLFGLGGAYKTEMDALNSTHWNFAEQLAVQMRIPGYGSGLELSVRHWSNGGIRLPNRGQDFMTLSYSF